MIPAPPEKGPSTYCRFARSQPDGNHHRIYHDTQYGFAADSDQALFERLLLEINQASLSWDIILRKKEYFAAAYDNFDIEKIACYGEKETARLLNDERIIRNRLKIQAAVFNARKILDLGKKHGSFKNWLDFHHPLTLPEWVRMFKANFKFTGGEITKEFLLSTGYLPGAHDDDCPVYHLLKEQGKSRGGLS